MVERQSGRRGGRHGGSCDGGREWDGHGHGDGGHGDGHRRGDGRRRAATGPVRACSAVRGDRRTAVEHQRQLAHRRPGGRVAWRGDRRIRASRTVAPPLQQSLRSDTSGTRPPGAAAATGPPVQRPFRPGPERDRRPRDARYLGPDGQRADRIVAERSPATRRAAPVEFCQQRRTLRAGRRRMGRVARRSKRVRTLLQRIGPGHPRGAVRGDRRGAVDQRRGLDGERRPRCLVGRERGLPGPGRDTGPEPQRIDRQAAEGSGRPLPDDPPPGGWQRAFRLAAAVAGGLVAPRTRLRGHWHLRPSGGGIPRLATRDSVAQRQRCAVLGRGLSDRAVRSDRGTELDPQRQLALGRAAGGLARGRDRRLGEGCRTGFQ